MEVKCKIDTHIWFWPDGVDCLLDRNLEFLILIKKNNISKVVRIKDLEKIINSSSKDLNKSP